MEPERQKKPYHHGDLRAALLDAALSEISAGNFESLSLRGLARAVGVSPAAPYHHFEDKNAVLSAVATEGFTGMAQEMDDELERLPKNATPRERLRALGRAYIRFAVDHPAHFGVMFGAHDREEIDQPLEDATYDCFDRLTDAVTDVCGPDAPAEDRMRLTLACWSAVHGAATLLINGPLAQKIGDMDVDTLSDIVADQLLLTY